MKKKNKFSPIPVVAAFVGAAGILSYEFISLPSLPQRHEPLPDTDFGNFLAGQHAVYANNFDDAANFYAKIGHNDAEAVRTNIAFADFLAGNISESAAALKSGTSFSAKIAYGAYLITQDDWNGLYKLFSADKSPFHAPLRIWSAIAVKKDSEASKFIDGMEASDSWKNFFRGQIHAERGDFKKAAASFAKCEPSFMNLNDYIYLMSFYAAADLPGAANELRVAFTETPGGLFMLDYDEIPAFSEFSGIKNQLAFSIIQTVSHSQSISATDLALVLLRTAGAAHDSDALNYYLGIYFYTAGGDYEVNFNKVKHNSPFYPFVQLKIAEAAGDSTRKLENIVRNEPLFAPAINKLVAKYTAKDKRKSALSVIDRALDQPRLTSTARAFFFATRAKVNRIFGHLQDAQQDLDRATAIIPKDAGVLSEQARLWAMRGVELDTAYTYSIALIKKYPSDIELWDTLGMVVNAKEGTWAALDIYERVGRVADSCSALYEHLGDALATMGEKQAAGAAYRRAIDMADDGLIIAPKVEKKLKALRIK